MATNQDVKVQYVFALTDKIDIEHKTITSADGQVVRDMEAGMIIAAYGKSQSAPSDTPETIWLYVAYAPDGETLVVHDVTASVEGEIADIVQRVTSLENTIANAANPETGMSVKYALSAGTASELSLSDNL